MKVCKINLTNIFLGIIALMLSIIVIYTAIGLVVTNNIVTGEMICEPVEAKNNDTVFVIED